MFLLIFLCGCSSFDKCDPWALEQDLKQKLGGYNCQVKARAAIAQLNQCPNIKQVIVNVKTTDMPYGHMTVKYIKKNGMTGELFE